MADNYPAIQQSPKSIWNPIDHQVNVIGPNGKPYVANDGRNYAVLHYDVKLVHPLLGDADMQLVQDHYIANKRLRFLLVSAGDGITYNCMYKSAPDILKGENNFWIVSSMLLASSTTLT